MSRGVVVAVIVAARGEGALAATLASVAWAAERLVIDPAGRVAASLPPGVRRVTDALETHLRSADWALLLSDDERATQPFAAAVAAATAGPSGVGYTVPRAVVLRDAHLRLPGASLRLVPAAGARVVTPTRGALAWAVPAGGVRRLAEPLLVALPASLDAAVRDLDAETTTLAAFPGMAAARIGWRNALLAPAAAAARLLAARGAALGWERWIRAVLAGYRVLVLQAKRWERAQEAPL